MSFFMNIWNQFNKVILSSRFHKITSQHTALITFQGRKSGTEYTTPVNYSQHGNSIRIISFSDRKWWRNLKSNPHVMVTLQGQKIPGVSQVFEDQSAVVRELGEFLKPVPNMARAFKVTVLEDGSMNLEELIKAAKGRVVINIQFDDQST